MAKTTGSEEFAGTPDAMKDYLAGFQEKTAFLPDYGFRPAGEPVSDSGSPVSPGTSVSGIVGSHAVLATAGAAGVVLGRKRRETGTA
jgi:cobalt/nickel transport system permease protein